MINVDQISKHTRTLAQLEEFALYATISPRRGDRWTAQMLSTMLMNGALASGGEGTRPFDVIRIWVESGTLGQVLRRHGVIDHERIERCWTELSKQVTVADGNGTIRFVKGIDLRSVAELEQVHGITPMMARFIVLHSIPDAWFIPITPYWIKELRSCGYDIEVREQNISGKAVEVVPMTPELYRQYERYALAEVKRSGLRAAAYDQVVYDKWTNQQKEVAA